MRKSSRIQQQAPKDQDTQASKSVKQTTKQKSTATKKGPSKPVKEAKEIKDSESKAQDEPPTKKKSKQESKTPATASKTGTQQSRRKRKSLERLVDAPLDVVFEVFAHLQPPDLLNLARTTKPLRGILMSRSARQMWQVARSNVPGLPQIPPYLSEPQYAHLAFGTSCDVCGRGACDNVYWESYFRCHKNCTPKGFYSAEELSRLKNWTEEVGHMLQLLWRKIPFLENRKVFGDFERYYLPAVVKRYRLQYMDVKGIPEKRDLWVYEKWKEFNALKMFAEQCETWCREWRAEAALVREWIVDEPRRERRDEIHTRMKALGYQEEDLVHRDFARHPLVNDKREVTDKVWATIEPTLVKLMEEIKEKRLDEVYATRYKLLQTVYEFHCKMNRKSEADAFPPIGDFVLSPKTSPIHDLIWKTPRTEEVTQPQFIRALLREINLNEITEDWKARIREELLHRDDNIDFEKSMFRCASCRETRIQVPRIYGHGCCLKMNPMAKWENTKYNPFLDFAWTTYIIFPLVHTPAEETVG